MTELLDIKIDRLSVRRGILLVAVLVANAALTLSLRGYHRDELSNSTLETKAESKPLPKIVPECHRSDYGNSSTIGAYYDSLDAEKIHRWRTQGRGRNDSIHQLAVHRGLGPKADSTRQYEYIEELVLSSGNRESLRVLDAGCGLGSGAVWMKRRHPSWKVFGVSMSPRQVDFCDQEFSGSFQAELRSYDNLDPVAKYDVIYSVEALVHSPNLTKTLQHWAWHLLPGGMIVLVDDYVMDGVSTENNEDAQIFADSWLLGSLVSLEQFEETAKLAGLVRGDKMVDITEDVIQWNYHGTVPQLPINRSDFCHMGLYGGRFRQRLYTMRKLRYLAISFVLQA